MAPIPGDSSKHQFGTSMPQGAIHPIIRSPRRRGRACAGRSRPSAFAVLRLIVSWYLVAACTGRSAGFSPLRAIDVAGRAPKHLDVRSGQHAKAACWLSRTQAMLDRDRAPRRGLNAWRPTICSRSIGLSRGLDCQGLSTNSSDAPTSLTLWLWRDAGRYASLAHLYCTFGMAFLRGRYR
jgi:hypothetical protein